MLSLATAGVKDWLLLAAIDEYGNDRNQVACFSSTNRLALLVQTNKYGRRDAINLQDGDLFHIRAVPFSRWSTMEPSSDAALRLSQDCTGCTDTLRGGMTGGGDGRYTAELVGYKKVFSLLALLVQRCKY